jgi:O-antigen/teichoic acid export membrane protein
VELSISERWHHPAHAHGADCAHQQKDAPRHVGRMSLELGIGQAVAGVVATLWLALAAHHLSVRLFGELTLVLSLGSLVSSGTDLGIPLALTKLACDHEVLDRRAIYGAIRRRTTAGVAAAAVLVVLWANSGDATRWWLAALYGISVTVGPVTGSFLALLRGRAIGSVEAVYSVASKLALPALGLAALGAGLGLAGVLAAYVAVDAVSAAAVSRVAERRLHFSDTPDADQRRELALRATLPLAAAGLVGSVYERIDIFVVALVKGSSSVALYAAAYKLYDAVLMPARAVGSAAVAAAGSNVGENGRRTALRLATRAVAVTVPIAAAGALVAPFLLKKAFGSHYGGAGSAVEILMAAALPGAALTVVTPIALLSRRQAVMAWTAGGLVANVVGNFVLLPAMGVSGASLSFLITETALLAACVWYLPKKTTSLPERDVSSGPTPRPRQRP